MRPFTSQRRILEGYDLLKKNPSKYILPIRKFESSIYRSFSLNSNNSIKLNYPSNQLNRTQDLKSLIMMLANLFGANKLWQSKIDLHSCSIGLEVPNDECLDIDEREAWRFAEHLVKLKKNDPDK